MPNFFSPESMPYPSRGNTDAMYIVALQDIFDPPTFWDCARSTPIPPHLKLHQILPNEDGTQAVCLWEADSVDEVRAFVEEAAGHATIARYFTVAADRAVGLPGFVPLVRKNGH